MRTLTPPILLAPLTLLWAAAPFAATDEERTVVQQWTIQLPQSRESLAIVEPIFVDHRDGLSFKAVMRESGQQMQVTRQLARTWVYNRTLDSHYWQCDHTGQFQLQVLNLYTKELPFDPLVVSHHPTKAGHSAAGSHISGLYKADPFEGVVTRPLPASQAPKPALAQAFPRDSQHRFLNEIVIYPVTVTPRYTGPAATAQYDQPPPMPQEFCVITDNQPVNSASHYRTAAAVEQSTHAFMQSLIAGHNPALIEGEASVTYFADWSALPNRVAQQQGYQILNFEVRNSLNEYPVEQAEIQFHGIQSLVMGEGQLRELLLLNFQDPRIRQSLQPQVDGMVSAIQSTTLTDGTTYRAPLKVALRPGSKAFQVKGLHPDYVASSFSLKFNGSEKRSTLYLDPIGTVQRSLDAQPVARTKVQ